MHAECGGRELMLSSCWRKSVVMECMPVPSVPA